MKSAQYPFDLNQGAIAMNTVSTPPPTHNSRLKNIGLFLASPLIGLVYAVLLPGKLFQLAMADMKAESDKKDPAAAKETHK
jgi:hypothetical protein